jgi:hypothetical protein
MPIRTIKNNMNAKDSRRESSAASTPLENYDTKEIASSSSSQYEEKTILQWR